MTLDELLLEWSYRSERGYPSLDNPSDVSILKTLLEKLDLPTEDILKKLVECKECGWTRETDADKECPLCDEAPYRYGRDIR